MINPDLKAFASITHPYLLVSNIPYFEDDRGRPHFDKGWHQDLVRHLAYLHNFTLAAPLHPMPQDTKHLVPLDEFFTSRLKLTPLRSQASRVRALLDLPSTCWRLWRAIGKANIVHTGVAGWPYPLGWIANPIARVRNKRLLIIVESAPWRGAIEASTGSPMAKRIEAQSYDRVARYWCSRADLSFYTQPSYLSRFHGSGNGPAYVTPASWINAEDILDNETAEPNGLPKFASQSGFCLLDDWYQKRKSLFCLRP